MKVTGYRYLDYDKFVVVSQSFCISFLIAVRYYHLYCFLNPTESNVIKILHFNCKASIKFLYKPFDAQISTVE